MSCLPQKCGNNKKQLGLASRSSCNQSSVAEVAAGVDGAALGASITRMVALVDGTAGKAAGARKTAVGASADMAPVAEVNAIVVDSALPATLRPDPGKIRTAGTGVISSATNAAHRLCFCCVV